MGETATENPHQHDSQPPTGSESEESRGSDSGPEPSNYQPDLDAEAGPGPGGSKPAVILSRYQPTLAVDAGPDRGTGFHTPLKGRSRAGSTLQLTMPKKKRNICKHNLVMSQTGLIQKWTHIAG